MYTLIVFINYYLLASYLFLTCTNILGSRTHVHVLSSGKSAVAGAEGKQKLGVLHLWGFMLTQCILLSRFLAVTKPLDLKQNLYSMNLRVCSIKADTLKERYQKIGDTKRATPIEVKYKLVTNILFHSFYMPK